METQRPCPGLLSVTLPGWGRGNPETGAATAEHREVATVLGASRFWPTLAPLVSDARASEEPGNSRRFIDAARLIALSSMGEKVFELGG